MCRLYFENLIEEVYLKFQEHDQKLIFFKDTSFRNRDNHFQA